jgi:CO/xanthine dehydrogenase Mo-binding subunit
LWLKRETAAAKARSLIQIEWEQLPIVGSMDEALKDEVIIQPWHGSNILKKYQIRKGDMDAGWAEAEITIESTYHLPYQEHAYLAAEAGISYIDDKGA